MPTACGTCKSNFSNWGKKSVASVESFREVLAIHKPLWVFIEQPAIFVSAVGMAAAMKGDIVKLSITTGMIVEAALTSKVSMVRLVPVYAWKGQLPKKLVHQRVQDRFNVKSLAFLDSHTLDAVGIGLWAMGEM